MQIRVQNLQRENTIIELPDDSTVKDLRQEIATKNSVEPDRVTIIYSGKKLSNDDVVITNTGLVDAATNPKSYCVVVISKQTSSVKAPVQAQAPVQASVQTPAPVQASVPQTSVTQTSVTQASVPQEEVDDDDAPFDESAIMEEFGLTNETDIHALLDNPNIVETVMKFRLQDPMYVHIYNMFPDETQALLSNKAFILATLTEIGSRLAQGEGAAGPRQRTIQIEFLPTEGDDVKEKFRQLADMGFDPLDVLQCLRANDYDMDMTLILLTDLRKSDS